MADIKDAPENMLRAWADCGIISSARFVEEMDRRAGRVTVDAPPLDYTLDDDLAIPFLHHDGFQDLDLSDFNDDPIGPVPKVASWILAAAVTSVVAIALWVVWP